MFLHHAIIANDIFYVAGILKECQVAAFDIFRQKYLVPYI